MNIPDNLGALKVEFPALLRKSTMTISTYDELLLNLPPPPAPELSPFPLPAAGSQGRWKRLPSASLSRQPSNTNMFRNGQNLSWAPASPPKLTATRSHSSVDSATAPLASPVPYQLLLPPQNHLPLISSCQLALDSAPCIGPGHLCERVRGSRPNPE